MIKGWKHREAAAKDRTADRKASAEIRAQRAAFLAIRGHEQQLTSASEQVARIRSEMEAAKSAPTLQQQLDVALQREAEAVKALQATQAVIQPDTHEHSELTGRYSKRVAK